VAIWQALKTEATTRREKVDVAGPRRASVGSNLCPALTEDIAKFPAGLNSRPQELFVWGFSIPPILSETEEHFSE